MAGDVGWIHLVGAAACTVFGVYFIRKTRLGTLNMNDTRAGFAFALRLYVKIGAWMFAIGGVLAALRILSILLSN